VLCTSNARAVSRPPNGYATRRSVPLLTSLQSEGLPIDIRERLHTSLGFRSPLQYESDLRRISHAASTWCPRKRDKLNMKTGILAIMSVAAIGIFAMSSASAQTKTGTTADLMRELQDQIAKGGIPTTPPKPAKVVTVKYFRDLVLSPSGYPDVYTFDLPGWMTRYGNIAHQDPDFRKNKGSSKAFPLNLSSKQRYDRVSYGAAAQAYAVRQAIKLEPGPTGLVHGPHGPAGDGYINDHVVIYGTGEPGDFPHKWIMDDKTFSPWCQSEFLEIFYGAARGTDGKWYFAAVAPPQEKCSEPQKPVSSGVAGGSVAKGGGCGNCGLPLKAGQTLGQMRQWYTPSRKHYLIFQADGNLVVRNADHTFVWGLNVVTPRFAEAKSAMMEADGNLVLRGLNGTVIWSALKKDLDSGNTLTVSPEGVLQLISGKTGVILWSSK
jgi:hypothetical protein